MRTVLCYTGAAASIGVYESWNQHHERLSNLEMLTTEQLALTSQLFAQGIFNVAKGGASMGFGALLLAALILGGLIYVLTPERQTRPDSNSNKLKWLMAAMGIPITAAAFGYGGFKIGEGAMDVFQSLNTNANRAPRF